MKVLFKYFKQLSVVLKKNGINIDPGVIAAIIFLLLVLGVVGPVLYKKWSQWRSARKAAATGGVPAGVPQRGRPIGLPRRALKAAWKGFLAGLPRIYRRSILGFQPFVVLGGTNSGAREIIDTNTDWERQDKQFLRSQTDHEHLHVYLGSTSLVQELTPAVVNDTSIDAREALNRLWQPIFRRREPVVVVPVNLLALHGGSPGDARLLAETIRGKINVLSWAPDRPVWVRVAITRLDEVTGFREFAQFASRHSIPLSFEQRSSGTVLGREEQLLEKLRSFERYLPLALTSCGAEEYSQIVRFLKAMPRYLGLLSEFLNALYEEEPLSKTPVAGKIYLCSSVRGLASPFENPARPSALRPPSPLRAHRIAAMSVASAAIAHQLAGFAYEHQLWANADQTLAEYSSESPIKDRRPIMAFLTRHTKDPVMPFVPSYFSGADVPVASELAGKIRADHFRREIDQGPKSARELVYYLALYHVCTKNVLGDFAPKLGLSLGLDATLVQDYLAATRIADGDCAEVIVDLQVPKDTGESAESDTHEWIAFFGDLLDATKGPTIEVERLAELRKTAAILGQAGDVIRKFEETAELIALLPPQYNARLAGVMQALVSPRLFGGQLPSMLEVLKIVESTSVDYPTTRYLQRLCENVRRTLGAVRQSSGTYEFRFGAQEGQAVAGSEAPAEGGAGPARDGEVQDEATNAARTPPRRRAQKEESSALGSVVTRQGNVFTFDPHHWDERIRNTRAREQVMAFVGQRSRKSIFFSGDRLAVEVPEETPENDGRTYFILDKEIEPRFTRTLFRSKVKPALECFREIIDRGALSADDRNQAHEFVMQQSRHYAANYDKAIERYYRSFGMHAGSAGELKFVLRQLREPLSALRELVHKAYRNTQLGLSDDDDDNPYLRPIRNALHRYAPLENVVGSEAGLAPGDGGASEGDEDRVAAKLPAYFLILEELETQLRDQEQRLEGEGEGTDAEVQLTLTARISPAGRLALNILRGYAKQQVEGADYRKMIDKWVREAELDELLARPFRLPIEQLYDAGQVDLQRQIKKAWERDIMSSLAPVLGKYPFNRDSKQDVTLDEMNEYFKPGEGWFWVQLGAYIEPISKISPFYRPLRSWRTQLNLPPEMYEVIQRVGRLSEQLWDPKGNPKPLALRVRGVPFSHEQIGSWAVTLTYLRGGQSDLFNFNQKPTERRLLNDWTVLDSASVGVQLTERESGQKRHPEPLKSPLSHWALLRLLDDARPKRAPLDRFAERTWMVPDGAGGRTPVSFEVYGDPLLVFQIEPMTEFALGESKRDKLAMKDGQR